MRRLRVLNDTRYSTADIRKFFAAGLRAMGARPDKLVTVVYTRPGEWRRARAVAPQNETDLHFASYCTGHAEIGRSVVDGVTQHGLPRRRLIEGRRVTMRLPPPGCALDLRAVARVFMHEVQHLRGVTHQDMTPDQYHCLGELPVWAAGLGIRLTEPRPAPSPTERAARLEQLIDQRAEHAREKCAEHEKKLKRQAALVQKWRQKVRYYDQKMAARRPPQKETP